MVTFTTSYWIKCNLSKFKKEKAMEKLVCNAPWAKAKTSRFAWIGALALAACAIIPVDAATLCVTRQTETPLGALEP